MKKEVLEKYLEFNQDQCYEEIRSILKEHCLRYGVHIDKLDSYEGAGDTLVELVGMLYLTDDPKSKELPKNKELIDRLKLLYTMLWSGYPFNELVWLNEDNKEILAKKNKDKEDMKQIKKEIKVLKDKLRSIVEKW